MVRGLVLLLLLLAGQASAGAWPREKGETFLSFSAEIDPDDSTRSYGTVYAERGIGHDVTLGLDLGGHEEDMGKAIGFVRWPVGNPDKTARMAVEIGAGLSDESFALRPGLSWGRGITWVDTPGWLSVETRGLLLRGFDTRLETDITLGLKPNARNKIMMQLQTGAPSSRSPYAKLSPSWVYEYKPGRHVELGVTAGIIESDDMTFKFGLWQKF